jgi:hypothetical protein
VPLAPGKPRSGAGGAAAAAGAAEVADAIEAVGGALQEIELVDDAGVAGGARMGFEGTDLVVADEAGDDVAGAFQDLIVGEGDTVAGLQDADACGYVVQEQPDGRGLRRLTPRAGRFASQDAGYVK